MSLLTRDKIKLLNGSPNGDITQSDFEVILKSYPNLVHTVSLSLSSPCRISDLKLCPNNGSLWYNDGVVYIYLSRAKWLSRLNLEADILITTKEDLYNLGDYSSFMSNLLSSIKLLTITE